MHGMHGRTHLQVERPEKTENHSSVVSAASCSFEYRFSAVLPPAPSFIKTYLECAWKR